MAFVFQIPLLETASVGDILTLSALLDLDATLATPITYAVTTNPGNKFDVSSTGILSLTSALKPDDPDSEPIIYELEVTATDINNMEALCSIRVTITLTNDFPPVWSSPGTSTVSNHTGHHVHGTHG